MKTCCYVFVLGDALSCLQLLTQRSGRLAAVSSTGDLQTTQNGVLALFYHAWLSKDWYEYKY